MADCLKSHSCAVMTSWRKSRSYSFWTLSWCRCTCERPSWAAAPSSGPPSSASPGRAVTALPLWLWPSSWTPERPWRRCGRPDWSGKEIKRGGKTKVWARLLSSRGWAGIHLECLRTLQLQWWTNDSLVTKPQGFKWFLDFSNEGFYLCCISCAFCEHCPDLRSVRPIRCSEVRTVNISVCLCASVQFDSFCIYSGMHWCVRWIIQGLWCQVT